MFVLTIVTAACAGLAAVLALLVWLAQRSGVADAPGQQLVARQLQDHQHAIAGVQTLVRDESERSRGAQTSELATVRSELRDITHSANTALLAAVQGLSTSITAHQARAEDSSMATLQALAESQSRALEDLRTSQTVQLDLLRTELRESNAQSSAALLQRIGEMGTAIDEHLRTAEERAATTTATQVEAQRTSMKDVRETIQATTTKLVESTDAARQEQSAALTLSRTEQGTALAALQAAQDQRMLELTAALAAEQVRARSELSSSLAELKRENEVKLERMRATVQEMITTWGKNADAARAEQTSGLAQARSEQSTAISLLKRSQDDRLKELTTSLAREQERARTELSTALQSLRKDNTDKLEQMRATVQEKLDATLGERLDSSFKQVSDRLESVHKGLGEMQNLAQGVGSLQRTLTNVRTRGEWGELALEALLRDILSPEQYARQHRMNPQSTEMVDFAIKMPGGDGGAVWLGVDSKFPADVYDRLQSALEAADADAIKRCGKALEDRLLAEAASISKKYVCPPHTTDFAVMYLPTEGLFAEVVRRPGLAHDLRLKFKVVVAGPTTLTALLGSLSMGFRSLAIQKRSSEAWEVLGQVKTEFEKSAGVWEKVSKQLETAGRTVHDAGVRERAISRRLRSVEAAPLEQSVAEALSAAGDVDEEAVLVPRQMRGGLLDG